MRKIQLFSINQHVQAHVYLEWRMRNIGHISMQHVFFSPGECLHTLISGLYRPSLQSAKH